MKGIYLGSYWMGENDIVFLMAEALKKESDLFIFDTGIYSEKGKEWYLEDFSINPNRPIRWILKEKILTLVNKINPDFIVINSGGMSLNEETADILKKRNIILIGISLSDPDVFFGNGSVYARYYDIFYTNSKYAKNNLYGKEVNIKVMPFAALPEFHKPLRGIVPKYDVVVVGHANKWRKSLIKRLSKKFKVGLFGSGWGRDFKEVHGRDHVEAINQGKLYLSFSRTAANFMNIKVGLFEAMACSLCVVTQSFDELADYFRPGFEILTYNNEKELFNLIDFYLKNGKLRAWIAQNGYSRLLKEHTWGLRWQKVLSDIKKIKYA